MYIHVHVSAETRHEMKNAGTLGWLFPTSDSYFIAKLYGIHMYSPLVFSISCIVSVLFSGASLLEMKFYKDSSEM